MTAGINAARIAPGSRFNAAPNSTRYRDKSVRGPGVRPEHRAGGARHAAYGDGPPGRRWGWCCGVGERPYHKVKWSRCCQPCLLSVKTVNNRTCTAPPTLPQPFLPCTLTPIGAPTLSMEVVGIPCAVAARCAYSPRLFALCDPRLAAPCMVCRHQVAPPFFTATAMTPSSQNPINMHGRVHATVSAAAHLPALPVRGACFSSGFPWRATWSQDPANGAGALGTRRSSRAHFSPSLLWWTFKVALSSPTRPPAALVRGVLITSRRPLHMGV